MNTFGNRIKLTVFGQSHAKALGVTIDGLPAGVPIDYEYIESIMRLRAPGNLDISTKRSEPDKVEFISGVVKRSPQNNQRFLKKNLWKKHLTEFLPL